jgi:hypothetical protein
VTPLLLSWLLREFDLVKGVRPFDPGFGRRATPCSFSSTSAPRAEDCGAKTGTGADAPASILVTDPSGRRIGTFAAEYRSESKVVEAHGLERKCPRSLRQAGGCVRDLGTPVWPGAPTSAKPE